MADCLTELTIFGVVEGGLAEADEAAARAHLEACEACRDRVAAYKASVAAGRDVSRRRPRRTGRPLAGALPSIMTLALVAGVAAFVIFGTRAVQQAPSGDATPALPYTLRRGGAIVAQGDAKAGMSQARAGDELEIAPAPGGGPRLVRYCGATGCKAEAMPPILSRGPLLIELVTCGTEAQLQTALTVAGPMQVPSLPGCQVTRASFVVAP